MLGPRQTVPRAEATLLQLVRKARGSILVFTDHQALLTAWSTARKETLETHENGDIWAEILTEL